VERNKAEHTNVPSFTPGCPRIWSNVTSLGACFTVTVIFFMVAQFFIQPQNPSHCHFQCHSIHHQKYCIYCLIILEESDHPWDIFFDRRELFPCIILYWRRTVHWLKIAWLWKRTKGLSLDWDVTMSKVIIPNTWVNIWAHSYAVAWPLWQVKAV
jgi:hypothetical protein